MNFSISLLKQNMYQTQTTIIMIWLITNEDRYAKPNVYADVYINKNSK